MRFYDIQISDPASGTQLARFTSYDFVNQATIPGALNIELDIPVAPYFVPDVSAYVSVWGIGLQNIAQARDFNNLAIKVYGGMKKGLPLAKPQQAGLLIAGEIQQAYGNWIGTEQTLDLQIRPSTGSFGDPKNLVLNWKAGMTLASALQSSLGTAFPGFTVNVSVSPQLVIAYDQVGFYHTLTDFAQVVKGISKAAIGGTYPGVDIVLTETTITVYDGTTQQKPKMIAFEDLIGQPTWIAPATISTKVVMRADIQAGSTIQLPPSPVTTNPQSFSQFRQSSVFSGSFQVSDVHHYGNFRQPDAAAWVTVLESFPLAA